MVFYVNGFVGNNSVAENYFDSFELIVEFK
jgi:hypothetical protein